MRLQNINNKKVECEEPCDGRLSSTVPREERGETPRSYSTNKKVYKEKAKELALKNGFDKVSYYGEWNGYYAYTASSKKEDGCCIGYPQFILVKDEIAHLAPYTQSSDIMGITSMPKDYTETLL